MDKTSIGLKLDSSLYERIKRQADKEKRSIANMIRELLKRGLESEATKQMRIFD